MNKRPVEKAQDTLTESFAEKSNPTKKGMSYVLHRTTSDGEAPFQETGGNGVLLRCDYFQVYSDSAW